MINTQNTYIIGDIHGCIHTLRFMLYLKLNVTKDDIIYFMGDYIDKGPSSKAVLDELIMLCNKGFNIKLLRGNHEQMMLEAGLSETNHQLWLKNGGRYTLQSFKVSDVHSINDTYLDFIESMEYYFELEDYILVHGGLNFDHENPLSNTSDMLWIRNKEVDKLKTKGKKLIVGHTPVSPLESYQSISSDIIKLDTGCVYKYLDSSLGYLTAFNLEKQQLVRVENMDN